MENEQVVYDKKGFCEYRSQVRYINGNYECFIINEDGGDWIHQPKKFNTKEEAIEWLESLT